MRDRIAWGAMLWMASLWTLGVADVAAQTAAGDPAEGRRASEGRREKVGLRGGPRAPFAHYFFDDFSRGLLDPRGWEAAVGVTLSGEHSGRGQIGAARLGESRADREAELRSVAIELAGADGVELSFAIQHRGVEAGERLVVEYWSEDGVWYPIEQVVAGARDSVGFSWRKHVLPADALHDDFRIRFRPRADDPDDAWYVGEVAVVGYEPMCTLTVLTRPVRRAPVEVVAEWQRGTLGGVAPLTRSLAAGTRVQLIAPPTVDDLVFSHWSLDDGARTEEQRMLTLEVDGALELVAHYRPWVPGRAEASLTIVSVPAPGVDISIGNEPEWLSAQARTPAEIACLTGERLALLAPLRTARLVFSGWTVDGQAWTSGENLLEHYVAGDGVLVAQYVLLGDVNGDGTLDKYDVEVFVAALIDRSGYARQFPDLDLELRGDVNGDGVFDALDVESFVDLLLDD